MKSSFTFPIMKRTVENTRAAVHSAGRAHMMAGFRVREWRVDPESGI